ncbi:MAG TPA: serine hydrolase domain-containing protein [Gemmatimonadaceae bacterium]|jgi:CubicO group peptidase (beta-lactamase class C family)|nr:serine hydrolase domain-containing protein [Gemmatimonadaceae bacterium]
MLVLAATVAHAQRTPMPTDATVRVRVDDYLTRLESLGYTGGVLMLHNGSTVIEKSYGFANREAGIRADTSTVYNLGSITKQFTAAAILRLEELGKLHTTDSISKFLPNVPADKRGITLHMLLTHTSGLQSDFSPTDYEPTTRDEYLRRALTSRLRTPPGQEHFYANSGYSLLAAVIEIVTGEEYETALTRLVLRPAGMLETGYTAPHWAAARIAHGYQNGRDWGTIVARISEPGQPYWELRGNGGLHTTLGDMKKWDAAQNSRAVLADSSRKKYITPYVNEGPAGLSQYAYGWAVMKTSRGTRLITHNGGNGIYVAEFLRFVDEGVTIFLTSTVAEFTATPAVRALEHIAFGEPYDLPPKKVNATAAELNAMAGEFRASDGSTLTLRVEGDRLLADPRGQMAYTLAMTGDTASSPRTAAASAKSAAIVAALVRGDIAPLRSALDEAPDSAELGRQERGMMADRASRWGAYKSFAVLGSVQLPQGPVQTTVRVDFERGTATNIYVWNRDEKIIDVGARPYQSIELIPTGGGEFRAYNARSGGGLQVRAEGGALVATTPHGTVRLAK